LKIHNKNKHKALSALGRVLRVIGVSCMNSSSFEVTDVFLLETRNSVVLKGNIKSSEIRQGMFVKAWVDSELYMSAEINGVEFIDGPGTESAVGLVLDTPEQEVQDLWLELCKKGDLLKIEINN